MNYSALCLILILTSWKTFAAESALKTIKVISQEENGAIPQTQLDLASQGYVPVQILPYSTNPNTAHVVSGRIGPNGLVYSVEPPQSFELAPQRGPIIPTIHPSVPQNVIQKHVVLQLIPSYPQGFRSGINPGYQVPLNLILRTQAPAYAVIPRWNQNGYQQTLRELVLV